MNLLKKLLREECAQDLAEYGIALAVIGLGGGLAALAVANRVNVLWSAALSAIAPAL